MTLSCGEDGSAEPCNGDALVGSLESLDELTARHRKEKKDLQGKITALKRAVPKGNNKQKKQVADDIARLEAELKERHTQELANVQANGTSSSPETAADTPEPTPDAEIAPKMSKAQKRREKKEEEEKRRHQLNREALVDALTAPSTRETQAISRVLAQRNLQIREIVPDGDCLYNALSHQLCGSSSGEELRQIACEFIYENKSDFLPFLTTADGEIVEDGEGFEEYCLKVRLPSKEGGVWGGEAELRAISEALKRRIEVIHADGRVTSFGSEETDEDPLVVSYHQHAYSLGEHYNSTEPLSKSDDDESDC